MTRVPGVRKENSHHEKDKVRCNMVSLWVSSPFIGEAKEQKGFVGYWKFDEGSGKKAIDSSNHENHGMIKGKPKWVKGQFGKALELDGATFVEVQDSASLDIFDELTMQAWVLVKKHNTAKGNNYVIDKFHVYSLIIRTGGDAGIIEGYVVTSEKGLEVRTKEKIELNKWFHFASTYDRKRYGLTLTALKKQKVSSRGR